MRKSILALLVLLPSMMLADSVMTFKGTITGLPDSCRISISNDDNDTDKSSESDTALAVIPAAEQFTLSIPLPGPTMLRFSILHFNSQFGMEMPVASFRFMADNEAVELPSVSFEQLQAMQQESLSDESVVLNAGKPQQEYRQYLDIMRPFRERLNKVYREGSDKLMLAAYGMADENDDSLRMFRQQIAGLEHAMTEQRLAFINAHPDYSFTALLISREIHTDYQYTEEELLTMAQSVADNADRHRLAVIDANMPRAKRYALGTALGNEEVTMADGSRQHLQQMLLEDGFTLFDVWASWCGPCRRAIPKIKAMSGRYASILRVNSISCDQKEPDWRKAMNEENMPWSQAIVSKEQMMPFMTAYNITTIPRLILVKGGRIVLSTNVPEEVESYIASHRQ